MVVKSYDFETKTSVGDCSPTFSRSWRLEQSGDEYILHLDGYAPEILEKVDREIYYYMMKGEKKVLEIYESRAFKQWVYAQWQSGDVWNYAPYLSKMERDILVYGNAQWAELGSFGD